MITAEKIEFGKKLLSKYFLYGYLCLIGIGIIVSGLIKSVQVLSFPLNLISILFMLFLIPLAGQFGKIVLSTKYKYRYYKISTYRLKTRGYKDAYFECEMYEPCFRLIIKDLLVSNGFSNEYVQLAEKCRGRNVRVERAKEKLLARVKQQGPDQNNNVV